MTIEGYFNENDEPALTLDLVAISIEVLIVTGFAGGLIVPEAIANRLTLQFEGVEEFYTVTGQMFTAPAYFVLVNWFGDRLKVPMAVSSEVKDALLGSQMLRGSRLTIDYRERRVQISKLG